ncbi:hypothetical protein AB3X52_05330 [Nocardioides sp. DS6]|uniref:Uncharacterized protein n=1 Tax=Nocardioides eburneus TaxID=3231482 RepID=A0ABV3SWY3_9ACTN
MPGTMRVPRSRGAISGILLVLLGVWGALIPFIGPYVDYAYAPNTTWDYTNGRLILEILPGVGAILGGLLTLGSANRVTAMFGGWLAAVSGAWFILGVPLSAIWGSPTVGAAYGGTTRQTVEYVGFFGGLGAAILFLAAFALGRFAVVGVREASRAADRVAPAERAKTAPAGGGAAAAGGDGEVRSSGEAAPVRARRRPLAGHRLHWHSSRHAGAR